MTVQTEAKISELLSNSQILVERTNDALSVIDKANAKALADIKVASTNFMKTHPTRLVKTVGVGGDFANLNEAFNYAGGLSLTCVGDWQDNYLELKLVSDITITKQTTYHNPNCHIFINGAKEGGKHTINYDYTAWGNGEGEIFPLTIAHSCVTIRNVIFKSASVTNKKPNLLQAIRNSYLEVTNCDFVGNGVAYRGLITYHSQIRLLHNSFDNFKWEAIAFNGTSSAMCWNTSFSNCGNNCIFVWEGSSAEISNISLSGANPTRFIYFGRGSYASIAGNINLNGCTLSNIAENTLTPSGILLK